MAILNEPALIAKIRKEKNPQVKLMLANVLHENRRNQKFTALEDYRPYGHQDMAHDGRTWLIQHKMNDWVEWSGKPWQLDFHNAGLTNTQRMLMAGNRLGKTRCAGAEVAFHMTGDYPEWWEGKRFSEPVLVWTGSPTNETSRDIVQKELLGGISSEELGTGFIPKDKFVGKPRVRQAGVADVVDIFKVRHASGGLSSCVFKTYEQGWRKWQGTAPQIVWMDEEPDDNEVQGKIYSEALTRLLTSNGIMLVTFTPLLGQTDLVMHFSEGGNGIFLETATWDDVAHLSPVKKQELIDSYPKHEVQARTQGVPMMGEGRIFTVSEEDIMCDPFQIPDYYARICGIDFGIDHPAAGAWLAWDRDRDIIFVTDCYRKKDEQSFFHAEQIKRRGTWIPVSWPHDGANREKGGGVNLKRQYSAHGVNMLSRSACYSNDKLGSQKQWPVIEDILDRMRTGGFKVFSNLGLWFEEFRGYHTKGGVIVSKRDDILKSTFYGYMMRRYAIGKPKARLAKQHKPILSMRL